MNQIEERLNSIQQKMRQIQASGEIAPENTWIQKFYVPKNGKRYEYYRLMKAVERKSKTGKIQGKVEKYLGKLGSSLYKRFKEAIDRRNELKKLQRIYQRLLAQCSSRTVSQGKTPQPKPELNKIWEAIERIEHNQRQIWKWLGLLVHKSAIEIKNASFTTRQEET